MLRSLRICSRAPTLTPYAASRSCEYSRKTRSGNRPSARDLRDHRQSLERPRHQVGELVELAIAVLVADGGRQTALGVGRIADHDAGPRIRMEFRRAQPILDEVCGVCLQLAVAAIRCRIHADKPGAFDRARIAEHAVGDRLLQEQPDGTPDDVHRYRCRQPVHDGDPRAASKDRPATAPRQSRSARRMHGSPARRCRSAGSPRSASARPCRRSP